MKKMLAVLLCMALTLCGMAALAEETIIMGSNLTFPPFEYVDDNGDPAGFDVEIAKAIAADTGKKLHVEDMAFDSLLVALDTGSVDFVIAGMTITDERKEQVDFSEPYFEAQQEVIMAKDATPITAVADLVNMKVAVQEGTTGHIMCENLGLPAENIGAFKAAADAVLELKAGRVDAVVIDSAPASVFCAENDDIAIVEGLDIEPEYYGIAVKKGNQELLDAINATIARLKEDGTYDQLLTTFFAE